MSESDSSNFDIQIKELINELNSLNRHSELSIYDFKFKQMKFILTKIFSLNERKLTIDECVFILCKDSSLLNISTYERMKFIFRNCVRSDSYKEFSQSCFSNPLLLSCLVEKYRKDYNVEYLSKEEIYNFMKGEFLGKGYTDYIDSLIKN